MPTVSEVFAACCKTADVTFKPMKIEHQQLANTVQRVTNSDGVCFALTLLWLSRYFKKLIADDDGRHFGEIVVALRENPGMGMVLRQLQQSEAARSNLMSKAITLLRDDRKSEKVRLDALQNIYLGVGFKSIYSDGLAALGVRPTHFRIAAGNENSDSHCCKDSMFPYDRMLHFVLLHEGITLIKLRTHYVGAIVDPMRPKFKFLDVNAGQAITTDRTKFGAFMKCYLSSEITKAYTKADGVIHAVQSY